MAHRITIEPAAVRELAKLPIDVRQAVADAISALADEPRPPGVKKLSGSKGSYRIRVGDYRVLYTIADRVLTVVVVKVGNRRDVYRPSSANPREDCLPLGHPTRRQLFGSSE